MKPKPTNQIELKVRAMPRSSQSKAEWLDNETLKIWVNSPPVDGEANEAIISYLAKAMKVPKRDISIIKGDTSRSKRLRIEGITWEEAHEGVH